MMLQHNSLDHDATYDNAGADLEGRGSKVSGIPNPLKWGV